MAVHVFFFYPETAGKSLEEIDAVFESRIPAWRSNKVTGRFEERVQAARHDDSGPGGVLDGEKSAPKASGEAHGPTHHEDV
jgi:hypothetical protein